MDHSAIRMEGVAESGIAGRRERSEEREERDWRERVGILCDEFYDVMSV